MMKLPSPHLDRKIEGQVDTIVGSRENLLSTTAELTLPQSRCGTILLGTEFRV